MKLSVPLTMLAELPAEKLPAMALCIGLPLLIWLCFMRSDQRHRGEMQKVYLIAAIVSLLAWFAAVAWLVWPRR
jgi:hypothetical protein